MLLVLRFASSFARSAPPSHLSGARSGPRSRPSAAAALGSLAALAMVKQFGSTVHAPVQDALEAYKLARVAFVKSVNELLKGGDPGVDKALLDGDVLPLLHKPLVQGARRTRAVAWRRRSARELGELGASSVASAKSGTPPAPGPAPFQISRAAALAHRPRA